MGEKNGIVCIPLARFHGQQLTYTHLRVPQPSVKFTASRCQNTASQLQEHIFYFYFFFLRALLSSTQSSAHINKFNMHPLELPLLSILQRSLAEWMPVVRVHRAEEPILDENPHRAWSFLFFFLLSSVSYIFL